MEEYWDICSSPCYHLCLLLRMCFVGFRLVMTMRAQNKHHGDLIY